MRKAGIVLLLFLFCSAVMLSAQDNDPEVDDWEDYRIDAYSRGDQFFCVSLGVVFPAFFINNSSLLDMKFTPPVGGTGSLSYNYFLTSHIFLGGELAGMFLTTIAGDTLFVIPFGVRAGYQFVFGRFEFPVSLAAGASLQRVLSSGNFGMYARLGLGAYFNATSGWSFGIASDWYWIPQWPNDQAKNVDGHFIDIKLSAKYSF